MREDIANQEANSDFQSLTFGLRTQFNFPLTLKMVYGQSGTDLGHTILTETDINRFNLRIEYALKNVITEDQLKPFINYSSQTIATETGAGRAETDRTNFSGGFVFQTSSYGLITLRFDQISYSGYAREISDRIINARYEYRF
jgi:hypothetical protein